MSYTFTADRDRTVLIGRAALAWNVTGKQVGTTGKACEYCLTRGLGGPDPKVVQVSRSKLWSNYTDYA